MKIYVVGKNKWEGPLVAKLFASWGHEVLGDEVLKSANLGGAELVAFSGGADVSPYLYGEENISSSNDEMRDLFEQQVFESIPSNVPRVGICRGGQFLNVMNHGKMLQHIHGHHGHHVIDFEDGRESQLIDETHHQGIVPSPAGFVIARDSRDLNVEIVYYENKGQAKTLCFQPHPDYGHVGTKKLFASLCNDYLGKKVA